MNRPATVRRAPFGALLAVAAVLAAMASPAHAEDCRPAHLVFHGGTILTMDDANPSAEAVAVRDGRILFVGPYAQAKAACWYTPLADRDLAGRTMTPGFIDAHAHLLTYGGTGPKSDWVDVSSLDAHFRGEDGPWDPPLVTVERGADGCPTADQPETVYGILRAHADDFHATHPDDTTTWIKARAYDPARQTGDILDRRLLDRISDIHPIFLLNQSGHFAYVNTPALEAMGLGGDCPPLPPGCAPPGSDVPEICDGILREAEIGVAAPNLVPKNPLALPKLLKDGAARMARHGLTTVTDATVNDLATLLTMDAYFALDPFFPVNLVLFPGGLECFHDDACRRYLDRLRDEGRRTGVPLKIGPLKFLMDGSPQGYSNANRTPYYKTLDGARANDLPYGNDNLLVPDPENPDLVHDVVGEAHRAGYQMAFHANGDLSVDRVLQAIEDAEKSLPRPDARHQLIHLAFANDGQLRRMKRLNMTSTVLVSDLYYWGNVECTNVFGSGLMNTTNYPVRSSMRAVSTTLHSDAPVTEPAPLHAIWYAATRVPQAWPPGSRAPKKPCDSPLNASERITVAEGLRMFTKEAAYQLHLEDEVGTLAPGKVADMAILSDNPLTVPLGDLRDIRVTATVSRGRMIDDLFWALYLPAFSRERHARRPAAGTSPAIPLERQEPFSFRERSPSSARYPSRPGRSG